MRQIGHGLVATMMLLLPQRIEPTFLHLTLCELQTLVTTAIHDDAHGLPLKCLVFYTEVQMWRMPLSWCPTRCQKIWISFHPYLCRTTRSPINSLHVTYSYFACAKLLSLNPRLQLPVQWVTGLQLHKNKQFLFVLWLTIIKWSV